MEIGQGSRPCGATLYQKVEIFHILGATFPPLRQLRWNFAQPRARRPCQVWRESVQRVAPAGLKTWFFLPVSKFNTGSLIAALRHPAGNEAYDHF